MAKDKDKFYECVAVESTIRAWDSVQERMPLMGLIRDPSPGLKILTFDVLKQEYVPTVVHEIKDGARNALFEIAVTRGQTLRCTATQKVWTFKGPKEAQTLEPQEDKVFVMMPGRKEPILSKVIRVTPVGEAPTAAIVLKAEPYSVFVNDILLLTR